MTEDEFRYGGPQPGGLASSTEQARAYAKTDAKRAECVNRAQRSSQMMTIAERIHNIRDFASITLHGTASMLEDHADRLHGHLPEQTAERLRPSDDVPDYGPGQMGDVMRSIDELEHHLRQAVQRVAMQASRNTNLA